MEVSILEKETEEWPEKKEESLAAEKTSDGMYKCKICGQIFPTMKAHDEHHRKMHGKAPESPNEQQSTIPNEPM
jgi:uncharacterized C2H2 Zn-finger protein